MKYRIIEYTYADNSLDYKIEIQVATNEDWKEESKSYEKEKDAEDWILAKIAAVSAGTVIHRVVLPTEYE